MSALHDLHITTVEAIWDFFANNRNSQMVCNRIHSVREEKLLQQQVTGAYFWMHV